MFNTDRSEAIGSDIILNRILQTIFLQSQYFQSVLVLVHSATCVKTRIQ
jgi:hypothetical protein